MSYMNVIQIASGVGYNSLEVSALINEIKNVTSWTLDSETNTFNISDTLTLNIAKSDWKYNCTISSVGDETVSQTVSILDMSNYSGSDARLYFNYCISSDGKCFAFGFDYFVETNPVTMAPIYIIIDEDDKNNKSAIMINKGGTSDNWCRLVTDGHWCDIDATSYSSASSYQCQYAMTGTKLLRTSICKQPNYLTGGMFKNVYRILSCPSSPVNLYSTVLDIGGKYYQGVNGGANSSGSFAISVG